jgi:Glyoxalase-like domain
MLRADECVSWPGKQFGCLIRTVNAAAMTSRISHTCFDASDTFAQSLFWSQVLDFVEDPGDPNEPGHEECLITSHDSSQMLLFITVPDGKQVKNRVHLDLLLADCTREQAFCASLRIDTASAHRPCSASAPRASITAR